jgi:hypothetical protein
MEAEVAVLAIVHGAIADFSAQAADVGIVGGYVWSHGEEGEAVTSRFHGEKLWWFIRQGSIRDVGKNGRYVFSLREA